ncbi:hypothetical protein CCAX7_15630 [Capsulimonas corticalis]|uniref:histidine kinase n=1 Tax=Capsulimonas corticalis TaxID=2219043 RepID=A0A402CZ61_9BACT|nr:ATP-binding protein [Capsulimonas corticalis]BDI29512.1 hypothetical protein CCAX7_15630 [Capsulimonas corticalis]
MDGKTSVAGAVAGRKPDRMGARRRHFVGWLASTGLALVLLILTGFVFWASVTTRSLTRQAHTAAQLNDAYQEARYAVGAEESLERKYRLEPGAEVSRDHRRAARNLISALEKAQKVGGLHERIVVPQLLKEHDAYLTTTVEMFAAVDAGQTQRVRYIDSHITDPVFGEFESAVEMEAETNHAKALTAMTQLDRMQRWVAAQMTALFTVGLLLLGAFMLLLRALTASSLRQTKASLSEAERQLVHSSKLASLGTLSAGVAHELNQPIAIIRGVAQQLQDEPGLSQDVQDDLTLIEGQTSRMVKIINHLRSFSRCGGQTFEEVAVNNVVRDCLLLVGAQLRTQNIELDLDLNDVPDVFADANELEQVVLNLITNARDAMDGRPGARIFVRTLVRQDRVIMEFRDNGPGIPEAVAERIFDPFFTTKEVGKGTGLGLSISHGIIEKHQGMLTVHNDGGAVFTIDLPVVSHFDLEISAQMPKAA